MGDDIHVEPSGGDVGGHAVDAIVDHAETIGQHTARLDAHDVAIDTLKSGQDALKGTVEYLNSRVANIDSAPLQPVVDAGDVAKEVVHELGKAADEAVDTAEPVAVEAPKAVDNEAKESSGGFMKMIRDLNLH